MSQSPPSSFCGKPHYRPLTRRGACGLIGAMLAAPPVIGQVTAPEVTLRFHHFLPANSNIQREVIAPWIREIARQSDGRLAIEVHPAMSLGGAAQDLARQVESGDVDIALTLPQYTPGRFPVAETPSQPFMMTSAAATSRALYRLMQEAGRAEYHHTHPLAFFVDAPGQLHTATRQVSRLTDLRGLRLRMPSQALGDLLGPLGIEPRFFPVTDLAGALQRDQIDGSCLTAEIVTTLGLETALPFHCAINAEGRGLYTSSAAVLMNRARYARLPADLREVIDANSGEEISVRIGRVLDRFETAANATLRAAGQTISELPEAEAQLLRAAAVPLHAAWIRTLDASGYDGAAIFARYEELLGAAV
ncbi:TRAP transporter substrate-binding protein [Rhodobacteraceae bacterium DSL-40]|uniref:TRAP transporter substrate-binding protein n=1 Tax=Amaricoccus sp. B4 TaxID=3368557 RepID=UPI000DADBFD1